MFQLFKILTCILNDIKFYAEASAVYSELLPLTRKLSQMGCLYKYIRTYNKYIITAQVTSPYCLPVLFQDDICLEIVSSTMLQLRPLIQNRWDDGTIPKVLSLLCSPSKLG